ncbi:hypothetical protein BJV82DRAFT_595329 [Fennellomyces sp. T-0311]|nr:hypothetical protein BJV82DRAFT_595329 [Fennellomyces sp. T-0311]
MEQNEHEISQSQGRKIDLLLVTKGRELELASNEWKTFHSKHLILQQQSKNLRCNAAILNNLYISSKGKVSTVMAVDFVGTIGYMYLLVLKGNVYVPTVIQPLFLPTDMSQLPAFIGTIKGLFVWKDFLEEQVRILKLTTMKQKLGDVVYMPTTDDCEALPMIFFTPKRTRKRSIGEVYDDDNE